MAVEETAPAPPPADAPPKSEEPPAAAATPEEPVKAAEAPEATTETAAAEAPAEAAAEEKKESTEEVVSKEAPVKPAPKPKPTKEELEKKALQDFKTKIEEAIKAKEFELPPPPPPPKEEAKIEEPAAATPSATTEEDKKVEDAPPKAEAAAEAAPVEEAKKEVAAAAAQVTPLAAAEAPAAAAEEEKKEEEAIKEEVAVEGTPADDVFLWGIPLLHTAGDERTDVILNKFLRARDFKVAPALAMLKSTILWRKSYKADEILDEDLGSDFDALAFMFGLDKEGHPVCYNVFGVLQDKELYGKVFGDDASRFVRWRVQLMEKAIKQLKFQPDSPNALLQVIDLKNMPWPAKKVRSILLGNAISLLQDNYPELVLKTVFVNVPWYYSALFSLFSPFLTQHQKSKFIVSRIGKSTEALFKFISPEHVPVQYGGFGRPNDEGFSGAEAPATEVAIKAGEKKTIELSVTTSGATVTWDVVVVGSEVSYGAEFHPDQEGGYTTIVEKTKKISAQLEEPIRNSFKTSEPGKVVLSVDNSLSKKKKLVVYRHIVKGSSSAPEPAPAAAAPAAAELDA